MLTLDDIMNSTLGRAAAREKSEKELADRRAKVDQVIALSKQRADVAAQQGKGIAKCSAVVEAKRAEFGAAHAKLTEAQRAAAIALGDVDGHLRRLTADLRSTADPRIGDARRALAARLERSRHGWGRGEERITNEISDSGRRIRVQVGNSRAVARVVEAYRSALIAFDRLLEQAPADVAEAIAAIVAVVDAAEARLGELDDVRTA